MKRRGFLGGLLGGVGALWLPEPERVRTYSFGPGVGRYQWAEVVVGRHLTSPFLSMGERSFTFGLKGRAAMGTIVVPDDDAIVRPARSRELPLGVVTRTWWGDAQGREL